jgi:arylformamidase
MPIHPPIWSGLTAAELESQYNPRVATPNSADIQALNVPANEKVRREYRSQLDVAYGPGPLHRLDIFPSSLGIAAPVHIFIHGGYWRAQDKQAFSFVATHLVPAGVTTVVINYELCPASTLDGVVESVLRAVEWVTLNIAGHGGDPTKISISGSSAGAHLGAAILATDWPARGLPQLHLTGATLITGIYNPEPARLISVNEMLRLDADTVARHNLEQRPVLVACPVHLMVGGAEPWQWVDQTYRYSQHLRRSGHDHALTVLPGRNHFSIVREYLDADSGLIKKILGMAQGAES